MKKKTTLFEIISPFILLFMMIGGIIGGFFFVDTWYEKLGSLLSLIFIPLLIDVIWRFAIGSFALEKRPSLIPYFFKDKNKRGNSDITEYYFLGRYYFDRADYEKAEKFFSKSIEANFYKIAILKTDENKKSTQSITEDDIKNFFKNNSNLRSFFNSCKLHFINSYNLMITSFDGFYLQKEPIDYYIKTKKILYPNDKFLQDFDEDKRLFIENDKPLFEGENLTAEQKEAKRLNDLRSSFDGSVDLRCIEVKFMLEYNEYAYYEKALEISNKIVDIVEKSTNQTILWRLLYVRGCAYHKLGDADLACQDWKRGIELGDLEFSQKMYDENCKDF